MKNLLLLFILGFATSCSNEESNAVIVPPTDLKLIKQVHSNTASADVLTIEYEYIENVLSKSIQTNGTNESIQEYQYQDGVLKTLSSGTNARYTFNYVGGLVSSINAEQNGVMTVYSFSYNNSGQLINETKKVNANVTSDIDFEYNAQGNISKITNNATATTQTSSYITYTYDEQKIPTSLLLSPAVLKVFRMNNNNVTQSESNGSTQATQYEYNSAGYPTMSTTVSSGTTYVTEYFYK